MILCRIMKIKFNLPNREMQRTWKQLKRPDLFCQYINIKDILKININEEDIDHTSWVIRHHWYSKFHEK